MSFYTVDGTTTVHHTADPCSNFTTAAVHHNVSTTTPIPQSTVISNAIGTYMAPIIYVIGFTGNILILIVMSSKRMRGTSTSDYLMIMAIADLLTITTGIIPDWLDAIGVFNLQGYTPASCKIVKFLSYACGDTATWIRVLFTLDRFMAICFPLKKTECCLPWRAKFYCLGAALAAVAKNMHLFWTRGAQYSVTYVTEIVDCVSVTTNVTTTTLVTNCGYPTPEYKHFELYVRPWIAFTLVSLIPFCIILICNIFIIRAMIIMKRTRLQRHLSTTSKSSDWQLFQTSAMCLAASFAFLICVTPSMILLIGKPYWSVTTDNPAYDISKAISNQMLYIINSVNFFLYCITGTKFRETLTMLLCCKCSELRRKSEHSSVHHATAKRIDSAGGVSGRWSVANGKSVMENGRKSSKPEQQVRYSTPEVVVTTGNLDGITEKDELETEAEIEHEETGKSRRSGVTMVVMDLNDSELGTIQKVDAGDETEVDVPKSVNRRRSESESSSGVSSSTSSDIHSHSHDLSPPVNSDKHFSAEDEHSTDNQYSKAVGEMHIAVDEVDGDNDASMDGHLTISGDSLSTCTLQESQIDKSSGIADNVSAANSEITSGISHTLKMDVVGDTSQQQTNNHFSSGEAVAKEDTINERSGYIPLTEHQGVGDYNDRYNNGIVPEEAKDSTC